METVSVEMKVPKEFKEVVDLIDGIVEKVQAKAEIGEYAELIGKLTTAADGVQHIAAEAKSQYRDEGVGYLVQKLMSRLLPVTTDGPA